MTRAPTPDVKITEALQPAAQLHDTYWRPATPEPSPLHAVAKSLASLSEDITSELGKMDAASAHNAKEAGETAFWSGQYPGQDTTGEGIPAPSQEALGAGYRSGVLPLWGSKASKAYNDGFQGAAGLSEGSAMQGRIMEKYNALPTDEKMNMDPQQFDAWVKKAMQEDPAAATANQNPAFAAGIRPAYHSTYLGLMKQFGKDKNDYTRTQAVTQWGSAITTTLEQHAIDGKGKPGGMDIPQATVDLDFIRKEGIKKGITQQDIDNSVVQGVIQQATLDRDANMLTILDNLKGSDGKSLTSQLAIKEARVKAQQNIANLKIADENHAFNVEQRENKKAHDGSLRNAIDGLIKGGPNFAPDPADMANIKKYDPQGEVTFMKMRQAIAEGKAFEDPDMVRSILADIYSNPGKGWEIYGKAMNDIKTPTTLKAVRDAVIQMETYTQQDSKLFETQSWRRLESFITEAGRPSNGGGSAFKEASLTKATAQALLDAKIAALNWLQTPEGKQANQMQRELFVAKLQKEMFAALGNEDPGGTGKAYTRTPGLAEATGQPSAQQGPTPQGQPISAPAGSSAAPAQPSGQGQEVPSFMTPGTNSTAGPAPQKPWVNAFANSPDAPPRYEQMQLGAEYRADIERIAKANGRDAQWVVDQMWNKAKAASQPKPAMQEANQGGVPTGTPAAPVQQANEQQAAPATPQAVPEVTPSSPVQDLGGTLSGLGGLIRRYIPDRMLPPSMRTQPQAPAAPAAPQPQAPAPQAPAAPSMEPDRKAEIPEVSQRARELAAAIPDAGPRIREDGELRDAIAMSPKGGPTVGAGINQVSAKRVQQINASPTGALIDRVARNLGMDPDMAKAIASIESSGNPKASAGSYHGLYQLSADEFRRFGPNDGRSIMDPEANAIAGMRSIMSKSQAFQKEFGRAPSPTEIYLMHQQGEGGLRAHAAHPEQPAWQSMASTAEGRRKGPAWAKKAIWGNVPTDMKRMFNNVENITSAQFIAVWMNKLQGIPYARALALVEGGSKFASAENTRG